MSIIPAEVFHCEVCGSTNLPIVLDLGSQPLPDDLKPISISAIPCQKYPLQILFCDKCITAFQKHIVSREVLFPPQYHYRAQQTKDVLDGMKQFAEAVDDWFPVNGKKVCDIGCNDGSLLDEFKARGARTTGIEPTDAATEAAKKGHGVDQAFFDGREAHLYQRTYGTPDVIVFTNVFAHIENLPGLLGALRYLMNGENKTRIVIENHYLGSVLDRNQFDTFYHEHPRTYSLTSFRYIAKALGMIIDKVEFPARYGGNIRVFLAPSHCFKGPGQYLAIAEASEKEADFGSRLLKMGAQIAKWKKRKRSILLTEFGEYGKFGAIAFPARASILINLLELREQHVEAVYEKAGSKKIGYFVPGTHIPIVSDLIYWLPTTGEPRLTDTVLLNLAWHIPKEIETRWRSLGYKGRIIQAVDPEDFK